VPHLRLVPDGQAATMHTLVDSRISTGRNATNSVVLHDKAALAFHAELLEKPKGWQIRDLNSKNGTFVNGVRETSLLPR